LYGKRFLAGGAVRGEGERCGGHYARIEDGCESGCAENGNGRYVPAAFLCEIEVGFAAERAEIDVSAALCLSPFLRSYGIQL